MGIHNHADELLVTLLAQGEEYLLATAVAEAINRSVENITEALLSADLTSKRMAAMKRSVKQLDENQCAPNTDVSHSQLPIHRRLDLLQTRRKAPGIYHNLAQQTR